MHCTISTANTQDTSAYTHLSLNALRIRSTSTSLCSALASLLSSLSISASSTFIGCCELDACDIMGGVGSGRDGGTETRGAATGVVIGAVSHHLLRRTCRRELPSAGEARTRTFMSFLRSLSSRSGSFWCQAVRPQARLQTQFTLSPRTCRNLHTKTKASPLQQRWRRYSTETSNPTPQTSQQSGGSAVPPRGPKKTREQMYKEKNRALLMYTSAVVRPASFHTPIPLTTFI